MKLSVNEAKLTGLWARNCATTRQVLMVYNLPSGPKSFRAFRETSPWRMSFGTYETEMVKSERSTPTIIQKNKGLYKRHVFSHQFALFIILMCTDT